MSDVKPNPEFLEISVIDQGFGMTPIQIQTAFQKYQTIPNPNSGKVDSFGLGLSIARHLVELQGGSIEIVSTARGEDEEAEENVMIDQKFKTTQGTEMKLRFPYLM